jgi:Leucine-rich repeat (LRR) protein
LENTDIVARWWQHLSTRWKQALAETVFKNNIEPTSTELAQVYHCNVLRFAGPTAPYPNMSFELEDLAGISELHNLEILVVVHQKLRSVKELRGLHQLKSLFINNNSIESLAGIENLTGLQQLYAQHNLIGSILPVQALLNLQELYVHDNRLNSLEGLTEEHAEKLEHLFCKPNDQLKQKELIRVERDLGIRCKSL